MIRVKKSERERAVTRVSVVGIVSNGVLGVVKIIVGVLTSSVAIMSDAINNLTDTSSSIITIIGTHLSTRHPDTKHPFGYGRIEYLTSLVIGLLVLFTGVELCRTSIDSIIHPEHVDFTLWSALVLAATVVVKIFLGSYTLNAGKRLDSDALKASGLDARSDAVATCAALAAVILYLCTGISIDAWVGAVISLYIVRTGFIILKETVSKIVGEAVSHDLAAQIRERVRQVPIVKGAYDLILNSYGPDFFVGSMNVEVNYQLTAEEICRELHPVQMSIYHDLRTIIVFGLYAVDKKSDNTAKAAEIVGAFCRDNKGCMSSHGLFVDEANHEIYCDIVVDFGTDHDAMAEKLSAELAKAMPGFTPVVTADSPFE